MKSQRAKNAVRKLLMSIFFLECIGMTSVYSQVHEAIKPHVDCKHSIFRHDNFIGCFSADKIKMPARKYFCFNIPVYKNMVEEPSCRSPYHKEYIRTGASGNPEDLCH